MNTTLMTIILISSAILNGVLVWYIIQLLKRFLNFQYQLDEFVEKIQEYGDHVDTVYEMERFYGDSTLSNLLDHSKDIAAQCESFKIFYLNNEEYEEELEDEEEEEMYGA